MSDRYLKSKSTGLVIDTKDDYNDYLFAKKRVLKQKETAAELRETKHELLELKHEFKEVKEFMKQLLEEKSNGI